MGLFEQFRRGLTKTANILKTDVRDLFKSEGRLVDDGFLDEMRGILFKTDMGYDSVEEIVDEVSTKLRGRVVTLEEVVARNYITDEKPDVVVDIIDASNLERNLYLAVQFMELRVPMVLVFNMSDVAKTRGFQFDLEQLAQLLGAPIVATVGHKGEGMSELLDAVAFHVEYPP